MPSIETIMKEMTLDFFGRGKHKISPAALLADSNAVFLDVRTPQENEAAAFPLKPLLTALFIPTNEIPDRLNEIPANKTVGIFCTSGTRASMVYLYLQSLGYEKVRIVEGGIADFVQELKPGKVLKLTAAAEAPGAK